MKSISIKPIVGSNDYKNNTLSKYKYVYTDTYSQNVYAPNAFLMYGYRYIDTDEYVSFNINSDGETHMANKREYSQVDIQYPVWSIVSPNITLKNGVYTYDDLNIMPASGSNYAPNDYNGILVDENFTLKYNNVRNYLDNNSFLGFVGWSLHNTKKDEDLSEYITEKYNFCSISLLEGNPTIQGETMYGSYWDITPKYVTADVTEPSFDCAVNILNRPNIYSDNGPTTQWINNIDPKSDTLFRQSKYKIKTSLTDI